MSIDDEIKLELCKLSDKIWEKRRQRDRELADKIKELELAVYE